MARLAAHGRIEPTAPITMPRHIGVEQHCEEDCGAACLATVALHHGKRQLIPRSPELPARRNDDGN